MGMIKHSSYVSLRRNAESAPKKFGYNNDTGFFGQSGNHPSKRVVKTSNPPKAAKELFDIISKGGVSKPVKGQPNLQRKLMPDGTWIIMRLATKSGSPAVEINIKNNSHTTKVKSQKIHFIKEGGKK